MPAHTMPSYTEFATKAFFSPFSFAYCNRIYYKRDREKEKNMNTKSNKNTAKVYFTGDLHFGHFNAIKYDCRPWSDVETMSPEKHALFQAFPPAEKIKVLTFS